MRQAYKAPQDLKARGDKLALMGHVGHRENSAQPVSKELLDERDLLVKL